MLVGLTVGYGVRLTTRPEVADTPDWPALRRRAWRLVGADAVLLVAVVAWAVIALVAPGQASAQEGAAAVPPAAT